MAFVRASIASIKQELINHQLDKKAFVLYFGNEDLKGESWCSDCVIGNPLVRSAIVKYNCTLVEVPVGEKPYWKNENHPLRAEISAIPTVVHIATKKQLIEDMSEIEKFILDNCK